MMQKFILNQTDGQKWLKNLLLFFSPVLVLYLTAVAGVIQQNSAVKLADFMPTQFVLGGISLYLINSVIDYLRKLKSS